MNRRRFLQTAVLLAGGGVLLARCKPSPSAVLVRMVGANAAVGHLLRQEHSTPATGIPETVGTVIVGGGVSGLSAAYHLAQSGNRDFVLLELDTATGGNACYGQNETSAYPLGAHYVPTPNNDLKEYLRFLETAGVITGYDGQGLPIYREEYLCFDPQERLQYNGRWQEGLIPSVGLTPAEGTEIRRFLKQMDAFRYAKGTDGKDAFAIPVDASSRDDLFRKLDTLTMRDWLLQNNYRSTPLHEYVNYCCRDDFGTPYGRCSAWGGIHYFAARKGKGSNAGHSDVLTWPEGNGFLTNALRKPVADRIRCNALALGVKQTAEGVLVSYHDVSTGITKAILARQVILAVPQYVAARLLDDPVRTTAIRKQFSYVPWLVANVHLRAFNRAETAAICWDNVWQHSQSLGYVHASHQLLQTEHDRLNLVYYYPFTEGATTAERHKAQARTEADWANLILTDMERVHPQIRDYVLDISVQLWGHSMAQPAPGHFFDGQRQQWSAPIETRIFFAHTDHAGISIFEEAFYQGLNAARAISGNA
ncbi:MAG: FAD-dependent oxidoreductase [Sphingobacteriales bacterium]|nr:MAG: FAD-dependent oxidoreductase [Sphingobacteriales bacterium]